MTNPPDHRNGHGARRGHRPRGVRAAAMLALGAATLGWPGVSPGQDAGQGGGPDIDGTRAALEKWVQARQVISAERRDWALSREVLRERIELLEREIQAVRDAIAEAEQNITKTDGSRDGLAAQNEQLKQASAALTDAVAGMEERTKALLARVPRPAAEQVRPLAQMLPEKPAESEAPLSQRFQNVIGTLNMINKFNREIAVASEVRSLPDGSSVQVTAMYLGLGQGYYVGGNGTAAGVGTVGPDAWAWTPADDAAPAVVRAIAVYKNEEPAAFVGLPVEVK